MMRKAKDDLPEMPLLHYPQYKGYDSGSDDEDGMTESPAETAANSMNTSIVNSPKSHILQLNIDDDPLELFPAGPQSTRLDDPLGLFSVKPPIAQSKCTGVKSDWSDDDFLEDQKPLRQSTQEEWVETRPHMCRTLSLDENDLDALRTRVQEQHEEKHGNTEIIISLLKKFSEQDYERLISNLLTEIPYHRDLYKKTEVDFSWYVFSSILKNANSSCVKEKNTETPATTTLPTDDYLKVKNFLIEALKTYKKTNTHLTEIAQAMPPAIASRLYAVLHKTIYSIKPDSDVKQEKKPSKFSCFAFYFPCFMEYLAKKDKSRKKEKNETTAVIKDAAKLLKKRIASDALGVVNHMLKL